MDHSETIKKFLALEGGNGSRVHIHFDWRTRTTTYDLCSVKDFVSTASLPWDAIKHLYKGDPDHPKVVKTADVPDVDNPEKYRWVSTVPIKGNDAKYGREMFCLKTGILRGQTMGEFYQTSTVD